MNAGNISFLSWVRQGIGAGGDQEDPLTGSMPVRADVPLGVRLNHRAEVSLSLRLYGPGDVTGIDSRQVIRTEPRAGALAFEPNLFPAIEFDRPDLPWLFTPARADEQERLRPWLVLVVVEGAADRLRAGPPLPALMCRQGELPDLSESWAWAHTQVALDGNLTDEALDSSLLGRPELSLSRLICPRRLRERTSYVACLVPAFEPGRKAGLGEELDEADRQELRPAWSSASGDAPPLPVYYYWEFATGLEGDFERLAERLEARRLPGTVGTRPLDISRGPGLVELPAGAPGTVVEIEGVLRAAGTSPGEWDARARAAFENALLELLGGGGSRVAPPVYGAMHAGLGTGPIDLEARKWVRQLNLDPRSRVAAALGTQIVQANQEPLVASGWEQATYILAANQILRQGQLGRSAAQAIYDRRVDTNRPGTPLAADRLLQVSVPAHADVIIGDTSAAARIAPNHAIQSAVTPAFRRVTRPGGTLARHSGNAGNAAATQEATAIGRLARKDASVTPPLRPPAGMATVEGVSAGESFETMSPDRVRTLWWEESTPGPEDQPEPAEPLIVHVGAEMPHRIFVTTGDGHLMSLVTDDGRPGWIDHARPSGTWVESSPTAIRDLHAFVVGRDAQLWQLAWDGDRWAWTKNPLLDGQWVPGGLWGPCGLWQDSRPAGGGLQRSGTYNSVFVVTNLGNLLELRDIGDAWRWFAHPRPQSGARLWGTAAVAGYWDLVVHGQDGLYSYAVNPDTGDWQWTPLGQPPNSLLDILRRPARVGPYRLALGRADQLFAFGPHPGAPTPGWRNLLDGVASILGVVPNQGVYVATRDATVMFGGISAQGVSWERAYGTPADLAKTSTLTGTVRPDRVLTVQGDGRLFEGRAGAWTEYGRPRPGGRGSPTAPPARHLRWRPALGFLSNVVVAHVDRGRGGDRFYPRLGAAADFDANVCGDCWSLKPEASVGVTSGPPGVGIALADIRGRSGAEGDRRDLLAGWVEKTPRGNYPAYRIGWDLGADGSVESWSDVKRSPTPVATVLASGGALTIDWSIQACDIDAPDIDGDGRPEIVMAYVTGEPIPRAFYRIGWALGSGGDAATGWGESQLIPDSPATVDGLGVAVADLNGDLRPDIAVLFLQRTDGGLRAYYRIGWGVNARGLVGGGWSEPIPVEGGAFPARAQGAGLAMADFSGSERPDLVVFHIENREGENRAWYRIGWDVDQRGVARYWSEDKLVPGWFGSEDRGGAIAIGDLDPQLLGRKREMAQFFRDAAKPHLDVLQKAQRIAKEDDAVRVPFQEMAAAMRAELRPADRINACVAARIEGVALDRLDVPDPLQQLIAAPTFPNPMYRALADLSQDWLLPGIEEVPPETVALLVANPAFIEAFMVGLNHEMSRELLWREFPTDRAATFFRQFWDVRGSLPGAGPLTDIPPIAEWRGELGRNATAVGGSGMLVLLIRGELLRRYPTAAVYARRAAWTENRANRVLDTETRQPQFRGALSPDLMFFGLPLTLEQALGGDDDPGWFLVFQEHPTEARFGIDAPSGEADYGIAPVAWNDLQWKALAADQGTLDRLAHVPVLEAPFGGPTLPLRDSSPPPGTPSFTWAKNAAHMAHIALQRPVLLAIHASTLLPKGSQGTDG